MSSPKKLTVSGDGGKHSTVKPLLLRRESVGNADDKRSAEEKRSADGRSTDEKRSAEVPRFWALPQGSPREKAHPSPTSPSLPLTSSPHSPVSPHSLFRYPKVLRHADQPGSSSFILELSPGQRLNLTRESVRRRWDSSAFNVTSLHASIDRHFQNWTTLELSRDPDQEIAYFMASSTMTSYRIGVFSGTCETQAFRTALRTAIFYACYGTKKLGGSSINWEDIDC